MILHGIEYQRPTSLNMRIMADHVTYSFLAFMKSIFHFCLGCYCGGYSQNGRSNLSSYVLTHWGRVTHICVGKLTIIGSDNGLSPERRQAITWTNAGILLIGPLGTNFSKILIGIQTFSLKKIHLKMSSVKCCSFCLCLNVLTKWKNLNGLSLCLQIPQYLTVPGHQQAQWWWLSPNSPKLMFRFVDCATVNKVYPILSFAGCLKKFSVLQAQLWDHLVLRTISAFFFPECIHIMIRRLFLRRNDQYFK